MSSTQYSPDFPVRAERDGVWISTHLVKVLQEVDYPALNLVLVQTSRSRVETNTLVSKPGCELSRTGNGSAEGSRCPDDTGHGGSSQRADDGGTEHDE